MKTYRILSWNVNGLRAVLKKNFLTWFQNDSPDILCLQEIKAMASQLPPDVLRFPGYDVQICSAERPGYSGVANFSKIKPSLVKKGFGVPRFDSEGRILQTEYPEFTLFNGYFPNGKASTDRLNFKLEFYEAFLREAERRRKKGQKIIFCGDVNTAHQPIDLARPKENETVSGFLPIERRWVDRVIEKGYIDALRAFHPEPHLYTWWDLKTGARERNVGWRIDYFFVDPKLAKNLKNAFILPDVMGSDHCPVGLELVF